MIEYNRLIDLSKPTQKRSVFLFGPRQTGKTFLLRKAFASSPKYHLLQADVFGRLSARPSMMREELLASGKPLAVPVIIDEIQKLPILLDEVHYLIEEHGFRFILTGSSSRKLKRGGANLLAGRAWVRHLYPLVFPEIPDFDLDRVINFGALPAIYQSESPFEDLQAYCGTYLAEEIQAEAVVRNVGNFSRFLHLAGSVNAELLNAESVSRECGVPSRTVRDYFAVLQDTLIGTLLTPYAKTSKRKPVSIAKFYFFDVGVGNFLAGNSGIRQGSHQFGKCFEHFIFTELRAWLDYTGDTRPLTFWRDIGGHEVDFMIGDDVAIEVKGSRSVHPADLKNLRLLGEDVSLRHRIVVSLDAAPRMIDGIEIVPWREFLSRLWGGAYKISA